MAMGLLEADAVIRGEEVRVPTNGKSSRSMRRRRWAEACRRRQVEAEMGRVAAEQELLIWKERYKQLEREVTVLRARVAELEEELNEKQGLKSRLGPLRSPPLAHIRPTRQVFEPLPSEGSILPHSQSEPRPQPAFIHEADARRTRLPLFYWNLALAEIRSKPPNRRSPTDSCLDYL